jgi:hypothetical protein
MKTAISIITYFIMIIVLANPMISKVGPDKSPNTRGYTTKAAKGDETTGPLHHLADVL